MLETHDDNQTNNSNIDNNLHSRNNNDMTKYHMGVAEDTLVLTKGGYFPIKSLENIEIEIWNGNNWSEVTIMKMPRRRHLITVFFSNGSYINCVPNHLLIIGNKESLKESERLQSQYLVRGISIRQENLPIIDGNESFNYPFIHGALCAFGCFTKDGPFLDIMGPILNKLLNDPDMVTSQNGDKEFPKNLPQPFKVPINSSVNIKLKWLDGFISTRSFSGDIGIYLVNVNEKLIQDIQLLLTTLGVYSFIQQSNQHKINVPSSGSIMVMNYILIIPWPYYKKLCENGLEHKYKHLDKIHQLENMPIPKLLVSEIIDIGIFAPTYYFIEKKNSAGMLNGILTGC